MTIAEVNAPEAVSWPAPRPHRAPEHDDELRHRVAAGDVEQPGLDGDPVAEGRQSTIARRLGACSLSPEGFEVTTSLGRKHATDVATEFSSAFRMRSAVDAAR